MSGWAADARCRGYPTAWWYPERGDTLAVAVALAICNSCPVRRDCLDEALDLEVGHRFGIRGGATVNDRDRLARTWTRPSTATVARRSTGAGTPVVVRIRRPFAAVL